MKDKQIINRKPHQKVTKLKSKFSPFLGKLNRDLKIPALVSATGFACRLSTSICQVPFGWGGVGEEGYLTRGGFRAKLYSSSLLKEKVTLS